MSEELKRRTPEEFWLSYKENVFDKLNPTATQKETNIAYAAFISGMNAGAGELAYRVISCEEGKEIETIEEMKDECIQATFVMSIKTSDLPEGTQVSVHHIKIPTQDVKPETAVDQFNRTRGAG